MDQITQWANQTSFSFFSNGSCFNFIKSSLFKFATSRYVLLIGDVGTMWIDMRSDSLVWVLAVAQGGRFLGEALAGTKEQG